MSMRACLCPPKFEVSNDVDTWADLWSGTIVTIVTVISHYKNRAEHHIIVTRLHFVLCREKVPRDRD